MIKLSEGSPKISLDKLQEKLSPFSSYAHKSFNQSAIVQMTAWLLLRINTDRHTHNPDL